MIDWLGPTPGVLWGNGENFDNAIVVSLLKDYGFHQPWEFWQHRDLRTLEDMARRVTGARRPRIDRGIAHHALEDAKYETMCAQHYYKEIYGS